MLLRPVSAGLAVLAIAFVGFAGARQAASLPTWRTYASDVDDFTVSYPDSWHRAPKRLVPNLLDPREILSLGTGALPVGGGGN